MIFANSWWVESKSLSANKALIAGCFIAGKIRGLTLLCVSHGHVQGARGLLTGKILNL